jgi:L-ectoine synthase
MIVRDIADIIGSEREVSAENWISRRILLEADGMGFSLHQTIIKPGTQTNMQYRHHVEAVFCIEGEGEVEVVESGLTYHILPGMMYALNMHERHILRAKTQMQLICVFDPPLHGREVHDVDGSYPAEFETIKVLDRQPEQEHDLTHF